MYSARRRHLAKPRYCLVVSAAILAQPASKASTQSHSHTVQKKAGVEGVMIPLVHKRKTRTTA